MAKIPVRREGQRLQQSSPVAAVNPGAARGPGESLRGLGEAGAQLSSSLGDYFARKEKMDRQLFETETRAEYANQSQQAYFRASQDPRLADDGGNLQALYKEHMSPFYEQVEGIGDEVNKRVARAIINNGDAKARGKMFTDMVKYDAAHKQMKYEKFEEHVLNTYTNSPSEELREQAEKEVDKYINILGVDPVTRGKMKDIFSERLEMAAIIGHRLRGNYKEANDITMGSKVFNPEEKEKIVSQTTDQLQRVQNDRWTRRSRARKLEREQIQDLRNDFEQQLMGKLSNAESLSEIKAITDEAEAVMLETPTLAHGDTRSILQSFQSREVKKFQDTRYLDYQIRIYKGQKMKKLLHDVRMDVAEGKLDPLKGASLLNQIRANAKKAKTDPLFSKKLSIAQRKILPLYLTPNGGFDPLTNVPIYRGAKAAMEATIHVRAFKLIEGGMDPIKAYEKAASIEGFEPHPTIPGVPGHKVQDPEFLAREAKKTKEKISNPNTDPSEKDRLMLKVRRIKEAEAWLDRKELRKQERESEEGK